MTGWNVAERHAPGNKITFALGHRNVSFGSISGNAQKVQMISGLPRQADMIVQDWQVR
jgi:hypothetical protein